MAINPMTSLKSRLRLTLLTQKKKNLLQQGFTLIELMIVVVILGILTSVALPSFLNQSTKAKGTEGKSDISSIIKNGAAEFAFGGATYINDDLLTDATCDGLGGRPAAETTKFDYTCGIDTTTNILTVTATGDGTDTSLGNTMTIKQTVDLGTGVVTLVAADTCQVFGGSKVC